MHDKTQVFPLTNGDYVHTRLTHSLEVMNLAVSLGSSLCRNADFVAAYGKEKALLLEQQICAVLKTAAFVHDIGNPPFGHYGEDTIKRYFKSGRWRKYAADCSPVDLAFYEAHSHDFTEFDGNAEGFRILAKGQYLGDLYGLNLTFAVLGAFMKYPNPERGDKKGYVGLHKHGVFATEEQVMETAKGLSDLGIHVFRAGIWKPRTHPGSFEGVGVPGLKWMQKVNMPLL